MQQIEETQVMQKTMDSQATDLIREIYQLTHDVAISDSPEKRLRLKNLTAEAEKRNLL